MRHLCVNKRWIKTNSHCYHIRLFTDANKNIWFVIDHLLIQILETTHRLRMRYSDCRKRQIGEKNQFRPFNANIAAMACKKRNKSKQSRRGICYVRRYHFNLPWGVGWRVISSPIVFLPPLLLYCHTIFTFTVH